MVKRNDAVGGKKPVSVHRAETELQQRFKSFFYALLPSDGSSFSS